MMNFTPQGAFYYSYVIIHMILFQQADMLPIHLNKEDAQGVNNLVIHWTELFRTLVTTTSFSKFIDSFIHPVRHLLTIQSEPRIAEDIKIILHLSEQAKTSDWYLYKNYT